jgi:hypothetical protein
LKNIVVIIVICRSLVKKTSPLIQAGREPKGICHGAT